MLEGEAGSGIGYRSLMAKLAGMPSFESIGGRLEMARRELWACGDQMARLLDATEGATVTQALQTLQNQVCRIAIIGQVKAGKSTFISALIGRPYLLPSDVNPWTTVVTNLHYTPAEQVSEDAVFTFFGPDEWNRIAVGGGLLRELTQRLVPGFDSEMLRLQLDAMRRRAEQRLGPQFQSLLGQRHQFETITRDLLERYVASGNDGAENTAEPGRYSDLTKSADLYFSGPRRGFPITLVDTPGTNDPLLVRDEITRLSLAGADIYIVVLTAQQPLSANDVALLRLLRGLHKDRVIVFINRIDQLRNPAVDGPRLAAHVRARLQQEFPSPFELPIILGSAYWGTCALINSQDVVEKAANEPFRAYVASLQRPSSHALPSPDLGGSLRDNLQLSSGIPSVLSAVDHLMMRGGDAHSVRQISAFLLELARSEEIAARAELRSFEQQAGGSASEGEAGPHNLQQWQNEYDQLTATGQKVQEVLTVFQGTIDRHLNQYMSELQTHLGNCLTRFTEYQSARLTEAYQQQSTRVWAADPKPLRDDLERTYLHVARQSSQKLRHVEKIVRDHLAGLFREGVLEGLIDIGAAQQASPPPAAPDLAPLSVSLSLDLDQPWWKAWVVQRPTLESRCAALAELIETECMSLVHELLGSARDGFMAESTAMRQQLAAVTIDVVNSMRRRSMSLVPNLQHETPQAAIDSHQRRNEQLQRIEQLRATVGAWELMRAQLANLAARCEKIVQEQGHF